MRHKTVFAIAFFVLALQLFAYGDDKPKGKSDPKPKSVPKFCDDDPRLSVRSFCDDLVKLREQASDRSNNSKTEDDPPFLGLLNHLDFTRASQADPIVLSFSRQAAEQRAVQSLASYRPDQQASAASNASGTTSLVSKAGATSLLSLALDAGALTRSVSGSTVTMTGNLDGMFRAITNYNPLCVYPCKDFKSRQAQWVDHILLQPVTVSVVTTLAQQSSTTVPASGQASGTTSTSLSNVAVPTAVGKLTGVIARYQILNRYDPHSEKFKTKWKNAAGSNSDFLKSLLAANDKLTAVRKIVMANAKAPDRTMLLAKARESESALADEFAKYVDEQEATLKKNGDFLVAVSDATQAIGSEQQVWEAVRVAAAGSLFTLEYDYNRPASQPETHDFKIIYGYAPSGSVQGMLSLNGAFSLYGGTLPPAAKYGRLRDGQLSGQYDRPFAVSDNPNMLTLSLAGYWQYQPNPSVLNIPAGTVVPGTSIPLANGTQEFVGTAGSLWVTQAKITFKNKSGMNIPFGVKWSNKSDLLSGNKIGAQVGISYDLSSIGSLIGGSSAK